LDNVFNSYLANIVPIEGKKTVENKRYSYAKHVQPYAGDKSITALDGACWQHIINNMLESGLTPPTAVK
jgi:hypothetical protein